jgi:hypothetical protein
MRIALVTLVVLLITVEGGDIITPPVGSGRVVRDTCANQWVLAPAVGGKRQLLVLPAQAPERWKVAEVPGLGVDGWEAVSIGEDGFVWLSKGRQRFRFDPRKPEKGLAEGIPGTERIAAQRDWKVVARMAESNHDLTGAVVDGRLYIAGGLTADWGFPARSHAFDTIQAFDPARSRWTVAAMLHRSRIYCATAAFDNKVWVVGGDYIEPDGSRYAVRTVEVFDPRTGGVVRGPEPELARPMPLALAAGGRLYVMGNARGEYDRPGKMESLGAGETKWRAEPDGPAGMGPLAGTVLDDRLYVVVPGKGLAVFDSRSGRWEVVESPAAPRSCQMAAWRGEILMMGGRDIENLAETRIFNPRTRSWRMGPALPIPLSWGAAGVVNGRLYVTGGAAERMVDDRTWIYNDRTFMLDIR